MQHRFPGNKKSMDFTNSQPLSLLYEFPSERQVSIKLLPRCDCAIIQPYMFDEKFTPAEFDVDSDSPLSQHSVSFVFVHQNN